MGSTFFSDFGLSPGPMTLASSLFMDSAPDFSFPSFSSLVHGSDPELAMTESQCDVGDGMSQKRLISGVSNVAKQAENDKPDEDGYNWRKYGQKQVKERERGYYRCSSTDCHVKKIVEWSVDGVVDSITYKGQHNHIRPGQKNKRGRDSADLPQSGHESGFTWESGNIIDQEERCSKKRNEEVCVSHRPTKEPKIIVQTNSAVDLLDDGFRWRKYGQKVVNCNPHPRSYYRCTTPGCNVRKQVERAAFDHKAVITIYEGKHNHQAPAVRI